jgi:hypothetical protein
VDTHKQALAAYTQSPIAVPNVLQANSQRPPFYNFTQPLGFNLATLPFPGQGTIGTTSSGGLINITNGICSTQLSAGDTLVDAHSHQAIIVKTPTSATQVQLNGYNQLTVGDPFTIYPPQAVFGAGPNPASESGWIQPYVVSGAGGSIYMVLNSSVSTTFHMLSLTSTGDSDFYWTGDSYGGIGLKQSASSISGAPQGTPFAISYNAPSGMITATNNAITTTGNVQFITPGKGVQNYFTTLAASGTANPGFVTLTGTTATQTATLITPATNGMKTVIKNNSSQTWTIASLTGSQIVASGATTASATISLASGSMATFWSDGTDWFQQ